MRDAKLRRLEQRTDALEARVDQAIDVLTRLTRIVAILHHRYGGAMNTPQRASSGSRARWNAGADRGSPPNDLLERRLTQLERRLHE
jgi:hypothetical protein